jgi:hypothetical protein
MAANNRNSMTHFPETPFDAAGDSACSSAIAAAHATVDAAAFWRTATEPACFDDTRSGVDSGRQIRASAVSRLQ